MSTEPDAALLQRARSRDDAIALARFDDRMSIWLVLAALLPLVVLPSGQHEVFAAVVNIAAWLVFLVDFVVHERRLTRYLHTWLGRFDLTVVILTAPYFLVVGPSDTKFVMFIRLARVARLVMAGRGARRLIQRLGKVALVALGVVLLGAAVAYRAEHPANPEFATYGDSLWWGIVTLTTVGYGDVVPKTEAGRAAGITIMFTGVAVLGVLAGSLSSFFRLTPAEESAEDGPPTPVDLAAEIGELRAQMARLADRLERLTPPADESG